MNRSSLSVSNESFVLLSRLSTNLRRRGRLLDLVWFQHSPAYAEAVLELAEQLGSAELNDLVRRLRVSLSVPARGLMHGASSAAA
jgi:hypothetical protein